MKFFFSFYCTRIFTFFCNEEIRLKRMTREKGIELIEKYDDSCNPEYIKKFCEYIDISVSTFWEKVHGAVNKDLFKIHKNPSRK